MSRDPPPRTPDSDAPPPEPTTPFEDRQLSTGVREAYQAAPAGAETRMFMSNAGLFSRQRQHKLAVVLAGVLVALLATAVVLDLTGVIETPGMGVMYEVTGVQDPNLDRAISRTENKLRDGGLSEEQRQALRRKLLGLKDEPLPAPPQPAAVAPRPTPTVGIEEGQALSATEHALADDIFKDNRKTSRKVELIPAGEIQAPNLPAGLTAEAIAGVIQNNQRSMGLCIAQGMKGGEKIDGRMEVELTIAADGSVERARIETARFNGTELGNCTVKTVKRWRFPRFNGEPVTVIFPFVLSAGM